MHRPPKPALDPWRAQGVLREEERRPGGGQVAALTVFLTGAECPFSCVFCDLWQHTLDGPTPPGALPAQLASALAGVPPRERAGTLLKLYNASNFFDHRAVPEADDAALAELARPFLGVVVESHPRLVGRRCLAFAERLAGRLEVAMGLETAHPEALARSGKGMTLGDFAAAARTLRGAGVGMRAFVLVGAPFVPPAEAVAWAVRSAELAFAQGVGVVSLIPVRGGGGLDALAARGHFVPPNLAQLEAALDGALALGGGVVTADLWDLERLAACPCCFAARRKRLARINLAGAGEPAVSCAECGA